MKGEKEEEKKSPNKKNRYQCFIIDVWLLGLQIEKCGISFLSIYWISIKMP